MTLNPSPSTTNTTDTSVQINWTSTSLVTIANTTIQYRAGYGEWNTITRLHQALQAAPIEEEHSHVLSNLAADTEYEVRLYCSNQWGRSHLSTTVRARTKPCESSFIGIL